MQLVYTRFHALPSTMNVSLDSTRGVPRKRRYAHLIAGNCASVSHFPAYPHVSYGTRRQAVANMPIRSSNSEGLMTSTPKDASRFRRPCADEHRERTTMRRREMGAGNCKRSRVGADRSSGGPPTESKPIGDRGDKLIAGFHPAVRSVEQPIASWFHSPCVAGSHGLFRCRGHPPRACPSGSLSAHHARADHHVPEPHLRGRHPHLLGRRPLRRANLVADPAPSGNPLQPRRPHTGRDEPGPAR